MGWNKAGHFITTLRGDSSASAHGKLQGPYDWPRNSCRRNRSIFGPFERSLAASGVQGLGGRTICLGSLQSVLVWSRSKALEPAMGESVVLARGDSTWPG